MFSFSDQQWHIDRLLAVGARGLHLEDRDGRLDRRRHHRGRRAARCVTVRPAQRGNSADERVQWPGRDGGLTGRESELLALLPTGMSNREIASAPLREREHGEDPAPRVCSGKLGVKNRVQAAQVATSGMLGEHGTR